MSSRFRGAFVSIPCIFSHKTSRRQTDMSSRNLRDSRRRDQLDSRSELSMSSDDRNMRKQSLCQISKIMGAVIGKLVGLTPVEVNMSSPKAQFVLDTIQNQKVVIFSKSYCPYCTMAKEQFNKLKYPFFCIELDNRDDADEIQNILGEMTGARTVPRVFIDGKFVGGGTDVKRMQEEGRLKEILNL